MNIIICIFLLMVILVEASLESKCPLSSVNFPPTNHLNILAGVWLTSENQILILSDSGNETRSVEAGRHILGLSNPASGTVYVTELGLSGPSVFRVRGGEEPSRVLSPQGESI